ncbi:3-oxoacyl-(acyl-carrier-protein) synthase III [Catenulispora acidiphila DSM 44928]|uniref:Beta-ketoacyl-[acyl-carrier-protein] synthase III n=1 Tax=Catenulispora acidiphila (strain DSM 44928 / JCM 14897 / NBRC 102108 / NRRL B-24433 / ID139908) TaxID=479433 RepID=C7PVG5_CATAD|nr:beta-ketoacyl-ACP synthase III [Catenulispora acidiphila]ACU69321.1 3-oxoacyl-(acyl-carrier-protein) synthase III [Catenulispora acidiphila DSM 44928]
MTKAAVISGIGSSVPASVVTNDMLAERLDTTDDWIRRLTGIQTRHWIEPGQATSDLAVEAGSRAIESAGGEPPQAVVLATITPDRPCPATAPEVASRLGLEGVAAFDVAAVCSGFVYGLATGTGLIAAGIAERVLVIGADTISTILDPTDRSTGVIFGDGAGAVMLRAGEADEPGALQALDLGSDGTGTDLITVPAGGSRQRSTKSVPPTTDTYLKMAGREVFRESVRRMVESCEAVLERTGWDAADVDRLVPHQANLRIMNSVADRLGMPRDRAVVDLDRVGNTSAASIPLALARAAAEGTVESGHRLLLTAFGGGLTWGSATLTWPDIKPV